MHCAAGAPTSSSPRRRAGSRTRCSPSWLHASRRGPLHPECSPGCSPPGAARSRRRTEGAAPRARPRSAPLRRHHRARRRLPRGRRGLDRRSDRPERRREDDSLQRDHTPLPSRFRRHRLRRRFAAAHPPKPRDPPRHRPHLPEPRAVPDAHRARERPRGRARGVPPAAGARAAAPGTRDAGRRRNRRACGAARRRPALRDAEVLRTRTGPRQPAPAAAPRRAGRRPQPRGGRRTRRSHPPAARRARSYDPARRAPHAARDGGLRARARPRLRPDDRRRRPRRRTARPGRDPGVPRGRARGMTALLELEDVEARYGPVHVLHGISLAVEEGSVVAVLGPNGAGKTTTLRAVSGTVRRSGSIRFAGRSLQRVGPDGVARLGIAHVPEGRGTFSELTVLENLRLGAYTRRGSIQPQLERVFSYFPFLSERRRQQAGTLSGGEQQMLALARAFVLRPRLLLLDEPSLGLAPVLVAELFRIVRELNEKEGLTVLVVEQNAHLALQAADAGYVLEAGRVVLSGSSDELRADDSVRRSYLGY